MLVEIGFALFLLILVYILVTSQKTFLSCFKEQSDIAKHAMDCLKATSLKEIAEVNVYKKQQDVALEQLNDAYNQELELVKKKIEKQEEQYIETVDGRKLPMSQLDYVQKIYFRGNDVATETDGND
jgi:uncharacterized membrane protein